MGARNMRMAGPIDMWGGKERQFRRYPAEYEKSMYGKAKTVAGITGKMVGETEGGAWEEDGIACGPGHAVERMGSVKGPASAAARDRTITRMKKQR